MTEHEILNLFHYIQYETSAPTNFTFVLTDTVYHQQIDQSGITCRIDHCSCGKHRINQKKIHCEGKYFSFKEECQGGWHVESAVIIDKIEYEEYYQRLASEPFVFTEIEIKKYDDLELLKYHYGLCNNHRRTKADESIEAIVRGQAEGIKRIRAEIPMIWTSSYNCSDTNVCQPNNRPDNERTLRLRLPMSIWFNWIKWGIKEQNKGIRDLFISLKEQLKQMFPALFDPKIEVYPTVIAPQVIQSYQKELQKEQGKARFGHVLFSQDVG